MLDKEIEFYKCQREGLLVEHQGEFVLIKETQILGVFESESAAYVEGLKQLGNEPFLIKQVTEQDGDTVTVPALVLGLIDAHI